MKKILVAALLLVAGLLAYNYATTGELSLTAAFTLSEQEHQVRELETDLRATVKRYKEAGRAAGLAGIDTTAEVESVRRTAGQIRKQLTALRKELTDESAKRRAERLALEVETLLKELR